MDSPFPRVAKKSQAYNPEQVDRFLREAREAYLKDAPGEVSVTSADLRRVSFNCHRGGYSARHVDAALDRLEEVFFEREKQSYMRDHGEEAWSTLVADKMQVVRARLNRPNGARFSRAGWLAFGYSRASVDRLAQGILDYFDQATPLTVSDIREASFPSELNGYREDQVDYLLDYVIDIILSVR